MATKIYDHITIDGDDAKLDASLIENLDNNEDFAALKEDLNASTTDMDASFVDGRYDINAKTNRVIEEAGTSKKRAKVSILPRCAYRIMFTSYGTNSPVIIFADKFNTALLSIKGESSRTNTIKDIIAPDNAAYLYVTHDTYSSSAVIPSIVQVDNTGYADIKTLPSEILIDYLGAGVHGTTLVAGTEYMGTITNNGNVVASAYSVNKVTSYAVESGKTYRIAGDAVKINTSSPIVGFGTDAFNGTDTVKCTVLIIDSINATVETDYDILFTAPDNGYVFVESYSTYNTLTISNTQYNSILIEELYNENKDSIAKVRAIIPASPYNYTLNDLFENLESSYIDDFSVRESVIDTDHIYTKYGDDTGVNSPIITTGTGIIRTGASGMRGLFYSRSIPAFPYYCLIGRTSGAQMLIKLYKEDSSVTENVISISGTYGSVSFAGITYGYIHANAIYCLFCVDTFGVTIFDDSGVKVYVPLQYMDGNPRNIAFGFGANVGRLFGYSSFVELVSSSLSPLDFNKCVALNRGATSDSRVKGSIRFTHTVWNNGASNSEYYIPEDNPYMELVTGLSNNPCIKCTTDYSTDSGYRTEIGITPIKSTLHGKIGGLQRFKVSADYFMASSENATGEYYAYIFQFHNAEFTPPQGWPTDPPPLTVRIDPNGHLKAFVTYVANGAVPASDNERTADEYDLGEFEMDKWMHLEVECRIGWSKALAPKLVIRINGQERLNIDTPIGFNIVSTGGYVNTHFGLYCPQWHDATFENTHREILVTNIHWEGTQNIW